jgi:uncharacterized protein
MFVRLMDAHFTLWLLGVSFGASMLGGMLGMASGIFIVPILVIFGHIEIHRAIGASIVSVIACSCGGASSGLNARLTNFRLAIVLEVATTLGALTGVLLAGIVPIRFLILLFAAILFISAVQMLSKRRASVKRSQEGCRWATRFDLHSTYPEPARGVDVEYKLERLPLGMTLMYGAGLISALLGIGSGVLKIPAMDTALRLPIKVSSATSNFMIGVTGAASAGAYFMQGAVVPSIAGPVALGSVVGALAGARVLLRVSGESLRLLFVIVLILLGIQMLLNGFNIHIF